MQSAYGPYPYGLMLPQSETERLLEERLTNLSSSVERQLDIMLDIMLGLTPVQHVLADTMAEVTIGYPESPLNGPSLAGAGPKPGQRVGPQSGRVPVGDGTASRFALFAANTTAAADLVARFPGLLDRDIRPPFREGGTWLVRPDGYLACSSSDTEGVANYLESLLRSRTD